MTLSVFAQALELAPHSALSQQALLQLDLAAAGEVDVLAANLFEIGKDTDHLPQIGRAPALADLQHAAITQIGLAGADVATLPRVDAVAGTARPAGPGGQFEDRHVGAERGRQIVGDAGAHRYPALVAEFEFDLAVDGQRWRR